VSAASGFKAFLIKIFFLTVVWSGLTYAEQPQWTNWRPYIPEKIDYAFELGSMWERRPLYWMSASVGRHIGRCVLTLSETCQQYIDVLGGAAGRQGQTNGILLGALRWQFVNYPSAVSPSVRVLAGLARERGDLRDRDSFMYGMGIGWTFAIHERADMRFEVRGGGGGETWGQAFFAFHLKMDKWVEYFGQRLKGLGEGAATATGTVIKGTLKTSGEVMGTVVGKPIQKASEATRDLIEGKTNDPREDSSGVKQGN